MGDVSRGRGGRGGGGGGGEWVSPEKRTYDVSPGHNWYVRLPLT